MKPSFPLPRLVISMGDPAGIGPEVIVKALSELLPHANAAWIVAAAPAVMKAAVERFGSLSLQELFDRLPWLRPAKIPPHPQGPLTLLSGSSLPFRGLEPGRPGPREGRAAWDSLEAAFSLVRAGKAEALVTAPVTKASLLAAGFPAAGHTDWLAAKTGGRAVMMLCAGRLRVVPVTMHVPLARVSRLLTAKLIFDTITITAAELHNRFGLRAPRLAVAGVNPHAGEEGALGREEERIIRPAVEEARRLGLDVSGPLPADTMFTPDSRQKWDAAICMFHDQALVPIKTLAWHQAVNLTLGLPIIRTSPAHGAAPDIAWQGKADPRSMRAALEMARRLVQRERGKKRER